jgi:predicted metal-binding transcription factor (methanogenesis marker protein 9)
MKGLWERIRKSWTPENFRNWFSSFGGRRFILSLGAGVATTVLAWWSKITPEIYRDVILGTVGLYISGSTYQKVKQSAGETTVQVAEATGEAPVTINAGEAPNKVELSTKEDRPLGY